jgi:predicted acylesterase/phospholipase RssA
MNVANDSDRPLANEPPVDFAVVLGEELGEIAELRKGRGWKHSPEFETPPSPPPPPHQHPSPCDREKHKAFEDEYSSKVSRAAHGAGLVGLAFSGGGIRSATFNLGVLQGFAKLGLLPMFDYLSTVSGGGYIGGWRDGAPLSRA